MISVAVKVETECGTCRMPMPVNTLAREVGCPSCGRPTAIGGDLWQALLRDPVYDGPKMLRNEGRRSSASKLSAAYTRRSPCCQGCEKEIPVASIVEVREQAMFRCEQCARQTWVRTVPIELAAALPNITHLVGEDPDPLATAQADAAEASTFPCPQCGSPIAFDGVNRAYTCRFCTASVHVPDDFVYRGRRKLAADWFLVFHPSIAADTPAAQAIAAGLFDWDSPPDAAVDADGNLYCAAGQVHWIPGQDEAKEKQDNVLWSIDPSLNIRWLQRGGPKAVRLVLSPKGMVLVTHRDRTSRTWLSAATGRPVDGPLAAPQTIDSELLECDELACDHDGSLLVLKDGGLRRVAPNGTELVVWPAGPPGAGEHYVGLRPVDMPDRAVRMHTGSTRAHCGPDGSIYFLYSREIARFDAGGRKIYGVELVSGDVDALYRILGADLLGNAYVLCADRLLRITGKGAQSVVLATKRDRLPQPDMSLAVCYDGSFWLFGKNGAAWKFRSDGALLFANDNEKRLKKPTRGQVLRSALEQQEHQNMAQVSARYQESLRLEAAREEAEFRARRRSALIILGVCALFLLLMSSPLWWRALQP
ncbi:hypothetical protein WME99_02435 [Sorangium sp. So ce136]|uniref:hypothetical protein n=1 Tax=Sorangium sp. So ce136 TaxID=3133284 RepID=UPI003F0D3743